MRILSLVRHFSLALLILAIPALSVAGVFVSVTIAPPVLPVYAQPPCPGDGYIWTPGYWAYGPAGYYWVPGTWVMPPTVGLLWTPGYWGWGNGVYVWHAGYWGPHIGFYGGVNYGFGYFGAGYEGGYWGGSHFFYNRSVNNVTITNVHIYNKTVINNVTVNRVSYNGGPGGIRAQATREQETAARERHFEPTPMQRQHEQTAGGNRALLATENHGRPAIAATARPGEFRGPRVVPASSSGGPYGHAENHSVPRPENSVRYDEHSAPPEGMHGGRAPQPEYNSPHGSPHPNDFRPDNARPHENAPQQENEGRSDRGHGPERR
ncbi:MAG TPA: YXWGXW repeat-containing protein [Terriglobales bacterium]|nr:YXWGXW repeat-containing protein [Terriglobales bacterium]